MLFKKYKIYLFSLFIVFGPTLKAKIDYTKPTYHNFFPYYSQCRQDQFLNENIFLNQKNGFFVEIGAHDGISYSNTYYFEKNLNWHGICIEPHPERFRELIKNRNNDTVCLPVAIANCDGESKFLQIQGGPEMLSGLLDHYDPNHLLRINKELGLYGGEKTIINVKIFKLQTIFDNYGITHIDLLSIDTEGSELEILKSIDFSKTNISVILVENNYKSNLIYTYLTSKNYRKIKTLDADEIYVLKK